MLNLRYGFVPLKGNPEYSLFGSRRCSDRNRNGAPHLPLIGAFFCYFESVSNLNNSVPAKAEFVLLLRKPVRRFL